MRYTVLMLILVVSSCASIGKKLYGIRQPKLETKNSVNRYLIKNGIDTTRVCTFKDLRSFAMASESGFLSFPNAFFFNEQGYLVDYPKTSEHCNAQVDNFISDLKNFSAWPVNKARNLTSLAALLTLEVKDNHSDITVFITFTTYSGRLNKDKAFEWIKLLEKAKRERVSVKYYLISGDYMQSWNIPVHIREKLGIDD